MEAVCQQMQLEQSNDSDWVTLVKKAVDGDFAPLYRRMVPMFTSISRRFPAIIREDAIQAARIRVRKVIRKIDLDRPNTIDRVLYRIVKREMMVEMTRYARRSKREVNFTMMGKHVGEEKRIFISDKMNYKQYKKGEKFGNILDLYADFLDRYGTLTGAHNYASDVLGFGKPTVVKRYNQAINQLMKTGQITESRNNDIVWEIVDE